MNSSREGPGTSFIPLSIANTSIKQGDTQCLKNLSERGVQNRGAVSLREEKVVLRPEGVAEIEPSGKLLFKEEKHPGQRLRGTRGHSTLGKPEVARPGCCPDVCGGMAVDAVGKT